MLSRRQVVGVIAASAGAGVFMGLRSATASLVARSLLAGLGGACLGAGMWIAISRARPARQQNDDGDRRQD
ncbi:MAG TPA: hypothetical protein VMF30_03880 [Pirellulales bacterium]|nr:hypothetical protein [Pirellulales bacterium]